MTCLLSERIYLPSMDKSLSKVTLLSSGLHSSGKEVEIFKDKCLYKFLFKSTEDGVQTHLSLKTVTTQRSGIVTLKLLVDIVTEVDLESVRNAEQELPTIRLKDHDHDVSKVVSIFHKMINNLTENGIVTLSLTSNYISASCNDLYCEDYRMGVKFF